MAGDFAPVESALNAAVASGRVPCAVAEVGDARGPRWTHAAGTLDGSDESPTAGPDTVFDLASLTKVIATSTFAMRAVEAGRLGLADLVGTHVPAWRGPDRVFVTIHDLLAHCSGLTAWLPLFTDLAGRVEYEPAIASIKLEYEPRERSVYSDLGFMLLGFVLEDIGRAALATQFDLIAKDCGATELTFTPPRASKPRIAPSAVSPWRGRLLVGEVHDDNAYALGGTAGHAGLFGTASSVGRFAQWLLRSVQGTDPAPVASPGTLRTFFARGRVPGSSRALGWDTMMPGSSCGPAMWPTAVGHTGFTGTSLWVDWERGAYFVLLTNRVLVTDAPEPIRELRRAFHTAAIAALFD